MSSKVNTITCTRKNQEGKNQTRNCIPIQQPSPSGLNVCFWVTGGKCCRAVNNRYYFIYVCFGNQDYEAIVKLVETLEKLPTFDPVAHPHVKFHYAFALNRYDPAERGTRPPIAFWAQAALRQAVP